MYQSETSDSDRQLCNRQALSSGKHAVIEPPEGQASYLELKKKQAQRKLFHATCSQENSTLLSHISIGIHRQLNKTT